MTLPLDQLLIAHAYRYAGLAHQSVSPRPPPPPARRLWSHHCLPSFPYAVNVIANDHTTYRLLHCTSAATPDAALQRRNPPAYYRSANLQPHCSMSCSLLGPTTLSPHPTSLPSTPPPPLCMRVLPQQAAPLPPGMRGNYAPRLQSTMHGGVCVRHVIDRQRRPGGAGTRVCDCAPHALANTTTTTRYEQSLCTPHQHAAAPYNTRPCHSVSHLCT